jgi:hypothetical protein
MENPFTHHQKKQEKKSLENIRKKNKLSGRKKMQKKEQGKSAKIFPSVTNTTNNQGKLKEEKPPPNRNRKSGTNTSKSKGKKDG